MSTTTTTKTTAKAPAKTTATRTPAKKAAEPKEGKTYLAAATGRGGKTNVRKVPAPLPSRSMWPTPMAAPLRPRRA